MSLLARILDSMRRGSSGRLFDIGFDEKGLTMESLLERCAGLDLHKDIITACVRVPGDNGERSIYQHEFGTTTQELPGLRDWLSSYRVTVVGMEATGVYRKAPFYILEESFECWLLNTRHMHNVPGRKTDIGDAEWIAQLLEHGLVRPSFVPPKPIRELRNLTRYRKAQIEERSREAQRLDKILQDAGIKLSSVATDIQGKSARAILDALVEGERDPEVLADLALGKMRPKIPQLQEALQGRFSRHHGLLIGAILAKIDFLDSAIAALSEEIDQVIAPFESQLQLLDTIPGVDRRSAEGIIAEVGADMSRFQSSGHLASWAGMCPGNNESAGKRKSGRSRKGPKFLGALLSESAAAAGRSKGTYLGVEHHRLTGRIGYAKANKAVGHSILVACWHILSTGLPYDDLGADWFVRRRPEAHAVDLLLK